MKIWFPAIKASSGADVFVLRLSSALRKRGVEVEVTWFNKYYEFAPFLLSNKQIPDEVDIVHASSWSGFAFKRPDTPLVITEFHCVFDPYFRPYKNFFQHLYHQFIIKRFAQASFQRSDIITAISSFTKDSLARSANVRDARLIYLWVETDKFSPKSSGNNAAPAKPFRLLFIGNISRRKGFDLLKPIMRKLGNDFELRFTSGLKDVTKEDYSENMIPLGRLSEEDLIKEYQECDALLFPSRFEGFGYVALEAMACGKPVVATDTTSIPEVVDNGITGILCPTDDVEAFVAACRKLAADRELCGRFGKAGRKRAEEVFSEEMIVSQYIDLYQSLLKN
jgi:glycosyltransferase involved in cell wall biosynthesis